MERESEPTHLGLGIFISLIAYLFFVTATSLVWALPSDFPTIQLIFIQNLVCLLIMLPTVRISPYPGLRSSVYCIHLIRSLSGVASYFLYYLTVRYLNLMDATTLNYTSPFFVPLVWWVWMRERVHRNVWCSIILGFIGAAVILRPTKAIFQVGFIFGICAGITLAIALSAVRILNRKHEPMRRTLIYYFLVGTICSFPFALSYWKMPSLMEWLSTILVGIATVCGQMLLTLAYRYGTASYLSPLGYSTVIYAGLFTYFIFGKPLGLRTVIGACLIILGGSATYLLKRKPKTVKEAFKTVEKYKNEKL